MKTPKSGELRDRIQFERKTIVRLPNGDAQVTWTELVTTFAKVMEKSGGYSVDAGKVNSKSVIDIAIRYRPDFPVEVGDRVTWRRLNWIIEPSPVVDGLRRWIYLKATVQIESSQRETATTGEFANTLDANLDFTL